MNVPAEEPIRFVLLIGSPIALLCPEPIEKHVKMVKNVIRHEKWLQNQLRILSSIVMKSQKKWSDCNKSSIDELIVCFEEFRDDFNPFNSNNANNSVT